MRASRKQIEDDLRLIVRVKVANSQLLRRCRCPLPILIEDST